jgi:hypothetical protein
MLLFLGYREFAYLPLALAATALPLVLIGIDRAEPASIILGSLVLGTGAAVHSFGLITLVAAMIALVATRQPAKVLLASLAGGTAAWGVWLILFVIAGPSLATGHAGNLDLRQLFQDERVEYVQRTKPGLFTRRGMRDVLVIYVMGGLTLGLTLVAETRELFRRRTAADPHFRELPAVLAFLVPSLGAAALIWPIQGVAVDTDFVMGLCAAFYALAWYVAGRSPWRAVVCWLLLAASHPVFWWVVRSRDFVN